jgi:hypothetical protein
MPVDRDVIEHLDSVSAVLPVSRHALGCSYGHRTRSFGHGSRIESVRSSRSRASRVPAQRKAVAVAGGVASAFDRLGSSAFDVVSA